MIFCICFKNGHVSWSVTFTLLYSNDHPNKICQASKRIISTFKIFICDKPMTIATRPFLSKYTRVIFISDNDLCLVKKKDSYITPMIKFDRVNHRSTDHGVINLFEKRKSNNYMLLLSMVVIDQCCPC